MIHGLQPGPMMFIANANIIYALFLGLIKNALPVAGISPFWQLAISGAAIIVAAGRGRRLMPYTDEMPKCLVPVDEDRSERRLERS